MIRYTFKVIQSSDKQAKSTGKNMHGGDSVMPPAAPTRPGSRFGAHSHLNCAHASRRSYPLSFPA